ncbi:MAG TPA: Rid family detoxifying hydrolase [Anaerolineales bacterium]|nr:Rid family detoxifying hydrolase [Anaerolineales bacterium]
MSKKQIILAESAPAALGPYSHAVRFGDLVFTAGQIGVDPAERKLAEGGIQAETRQALTNLQNVLAAAGSSLDNVLKTTVFLRDIADFADFNAAYAEFFSADRPGAGFPARTTVQAGALPGGAAVEIEAVACIK